MLISLTPLDVTKEHFFQKVDLNNFGDEGYYLPKNSFFISASDGYVRIPEGFVGYVKESAPTSFFPFNTHANAPYIGPRGVFEGNITFENKMKVEGYVRKGMVQSKLFLFPLEGRINNQSQSRYHGQNGATLSKL